MTWQALVNRAIARTHFATLPLRPTGLVVGRCPKPPFVFINKIKRGFGGYPQLGSVANAPHLAAAMLIALLLPTSPAHAEDPARLFTEHCAACHGGDRLGAIGPALLPENLGRLKKGEAESIIAHGRPATRMDGFEGKISAEGIKALAEYVFTPLPAVPDWGMAEITASRTMFVDPATLPDHPSFASDPLNLFTVVETGDHHVTILDGDRMEPLARFPTRFALHGGAKYSPDGRFVYLGSRDGWVQKYDLWSLQMVAEVRAGINARNVAVSHDGKLLAVGNVLPHSLVLLDAESLLPVEILPAPGRISAVYTAPPRSSFVVALKDAREIWEIPYGANRGLIYRGFVHNYEKGMAEGLADKNLYPYRSIATEDYLDDFFFDPSYRNLIGASRDGGQGRVVNLTTGREIARVDLAGMPHLGSGIAFTWQGHPVLATPHLKDAAITVIDMTTWQTIKRIDTLGPGFFMRGHENSPYAWVDVSLGKDKDAIQVIDTRSLEIVRTLRPAPGKNTAHVEFTRDGRFALVSVMEKDGALVVYDAETFEEVKRLPMNRPSGKYNVFNKITYSNGTSH
jgi:mono/diheme cytochrome c family protein/DNA-binding beta-propeller fold protein YncE